jgi:hypothetical protein
MKLISAAKKVFIAQVPFRQEAAIVGKNATRTICRFRQFVVRTKSGASFCRNTTLPKSIFERFAFNDVGAVET